MILVELSTRTDLRMRNALMIRSILKAGMIRAIMVIQLFFRNPSLRGVTKNLIRNYRIKSIQMT